MKELKHQSSETEIKIYRSINIYLIIQCYERQGKREKNTSLRTDLNLDRFPVLTDEFFPVGFADEWKFLWFLELIVFHFILGASPSSTNTGRTPLFSSAIVRKKRFLLKTKPTLS